MLENVPVAALVVSVASLWLAYTAYTHGVGSKEAEREIKGLMFDLDQTKFRRLEKLASRGIPEAQFRVGCMYATGRYFRPHFFVQRDDVQAYALLYRAAVAGHEGAAAYIQDKMTPAKAKSLASLAAERRTMRQLERLKYWPMGVFSISCMASTIFRAVLDPSVESWWRSERGPSFEFVFVAMLVTAVLALIRNWFDE